MGVAALLRATSLQLRTARRLLTTRKGPLSVRLQGGSDKLVFVVGSPRSGTSFLARSIGSLPGFIDLGEVAAWKASIPALAAAAPHDAAPKLRRILTLTRMLGLVGGLRGVEQTPETAFVIDSVRVVFPRSTIIHIVRDGRDVVCSLLEQGWLSAGRRGGDDAGLPYGPAPRFWVEQERSQEFAQASDARRAAWAWRRYVSAARSASSELFELRYEQLVKRPAAVAHTLSKLLGVPVELLAATLATAHAGSVGRFRRDLSQSQLMDVLAESEPLLTELGYVEAGSA